MLLHVLSISDWLLISNTEIFNLKRIDMNKYMNKVFALGMVVGALTLGSCSSDYLDTDPTGSLNASGALQNTDEAMKSLNGIAKCMTTQQSYFGQGFCGENAIYRLYESMPSQNWNYNVYAAGWSPLHNQEFHMNTNSVYDSYAWYYYYQLVGQANTIIAGIDNAEGSEADRQFIKAAALTFRAYSFEKLVRYYCYRWQDSNNGASRGIVLRLDETTGDHNVATLAETYAQIYKDCQDAIALFNESGVDRPSGKVWIPNVNVAHAVYARAALNRQDYATALAEAKAARQGYPLMSNEDYMAGFCRPTSEWIMGSFGDATENTWYWSYGTQDACNGYYAAATQCGAGSIGHELISRIPNDDVRKQNFITEDKLGIDITKPGTLDGTYGYIGLTSDLSGIADKDAYMAAYEFVNSRQISGLPPVYESEIYHIDGQLKFWVLDLPGVSYLPFIRSSEMYLIEAEANYFLGDIPAAQASLVELNTATNRTPGYTCTLTGEDLFNEIKDYREVELWGEGFAWSDYKRWNIPVVRHSFAQGGNAHAAVAITVAADSGNKWTWEVPLAETEYNRAFKNADATGATMK